MMMTSRKRSSQLLPSAGAPAPRAAERGYTLVALLAVMAVLALVVTSAAPSLRQQSQRDLEREAIARGEEVAEAIARYAESQQRLGRQGAQALPTSMDDLLKGVEPFPGSFKKVQILRREATRDPLSSSGEWKLVRLNDRAFTDFQLAVIKYNGGQVPQPVLYKSFGLLLPQAGVTGLVDLKREEEPPGGEDTESNTSGPFVGVVSRSRRKSVLAYYGVERHDRWVFTPAYR